MARDRPLEAPSTEAAATATESALDRTIDRVIRIDEGLNAVYRIDFADGHRAILKAATLTPDAELLAEPLLLTRIGRGTAVPVPDVVAAVHSDDGPLEMSYFLMEYCTGRELTDALALSPTGHERLVRDAGRYLSAIHAIDIVDDYGTLRADGDELIVAPGYDSWGPWFAELATDVVNGLTGEGYYTDDDGRFADLSQTVRAALIGAATSFAEPRRPAVLHHDYRPANLVLASTDDAAPLTRAVLDFGECPMGDGLLDCALAEDALIDVPLGGTERADRLRSVLRTTYVNSQEGDHTRVFDARYPYYRLYARACRLGSFDYWVQFVREDDTDAVARRWRSFIHERLNEIE